MTDKHPTHIYFEVAEDRERCDYIIQFSDDSETRFCVPADEMSAFISSLFAGVCELSLVRVDAGLQETIIPPISDATAFNIKSPLNALAWHNTREAPLFVFQVGPVRFQVELPKGRLRGLGNDFIKMADILEKPQKTH